MLSDLLPYGHLGLMAFVALAAAVAWWVHRLDVARSIIAPLRHKAREKEIASRTEGLKHRARDISEHRDERDLDARLHDSLRTDPGDWSESPDMALPGVEALPDPPEAGR